MRPSEHSVDHRLCLLGCLASLAVTWQDQTVCRNGMRGPQRLFHVPSWYMLSHASRRIVRVEPVPEQARYDDSFRGCVLQEQAAALHALGMMDYGEMKARLMLTTAALVATGSTICWIHGDTGAAQCLGMRRAYTGHTHPAGMPRLVNDELVAA